MIDSRRVLCSYDCDGAQSFHASQMENRQRTIAAIQPERPTKVRRNSNATGSKDDLERQLLLISTTSLAYETHVMSHFSTASPTPQ